MKNSTHFLAETCIFLSFHEKFKLPSPSNFCLRFGLKNITFQRVDSNKVFRVGGALQTVSLQRVTVR